MNAKMLFKLIPYVLVISLLIVYYRVESSDGYPVHTITSWQQVANTFEQQPPNTLFLVDVDDTLIRPSINDLLAQGVEEWPWWLRCYLVIRHPSLLIPSHWEHFYSILWEQVPQKLIEQEAVDIIVNTQKHGNMVLALTGMESGAYGVIPSMPKWRYQMLKAMGITFSQQFPDTIFTTFALYRNSHPALYKGIACCNQQPKGEVLTALITHFNYRPSRIVYIDDDYDALQSVGKACKNLNIPYTLYHYCRTPISVIPWTVKSSMDHVDCVIKTEQYTCY